MDNQDEMFKFIFDEDDVRWQSLIYEMVRSGKVDPWDVDISKFTKEYMKMLDNLKQMNFRVSGKVILSAAILLKLKTQHLGLDDFIVLTEEPEEDLALLASEDEYTDPDEEKLVQLAKQMKNKKKYKVKPKLIGPRTRKVTVFELVGALKKALEVDERRKVRKVKIEQAVPRKEFKVKKVDILGKIRDVYERIRLEVGKETGKVIAFDSLILENNRKEIIWTFIPLLHLAHEDKVGLHQKESFGRIDIELLEKEMRSRLKN